MANEQEWIDDVRRWYFGGHPPLGELASDGSQGHDELAVGYEADSRGLQESRWPDALVPGSR